jgi:D-tyrosyl-tRNA(Tyr) deacylase
MRAVLQRVSQARVTVDDEVVGEIGLGWLVLVGVGHGDTSAKADALAERIANLRCFADAQDKTNLSLLDVGGAVLLVSQFTLYADTSRGRRPGFTNAAAPEPAAELVQAVATALERLGVRVSQGRFGAHMHVSLTNDGPFTLVLEL